MMVICVSLVIITFVGRLMDFDITYMHVWFACPCAMSRVMPDLEPKTSMVMGAMAHMLVIFTSMVVICISLGGHCHLCWVTRGFQH